MFSQYVFQDDQEICDAGYVLGRYANISDNLKSDWLPIKENVEFNISKYAYEALNDKLWPTYLRIETVKKQQSYDQRTQDQK